MAYVGRYINMDRSRERRVKLEARLAELGIADRYSRFAAIDGRTLPRGRAKITPGEVGCFRSHYQCIKDSMHAEAHVHVVEDDVVFGPSSAPILDQCIEDALGMADIAYTDVFLMANLASMVQVMGYYRLTGILDTPGQPAFVNFFDLKKQSFTAASSYVVKAGARRRLLRLMEDELAAGPTMPVDAFYKKLIDDGEINAVVTLPFLTTVDPQALVSTTIEGRSQDDRSNLAFFLFRNYFFIDRDAAQIAGILADLSGSLKHPGFMDPILRGLEFVFSENFRAF